MKNLGIRFFTIILAMVVLSSCEDDDVRDVAELKSKAHVNSLKAVRYLPPDSVELDNVELYMMKGTAASGTMKMNITSMLGSLMGSISFAVDTIANGTSWISFRFPQGTKLQRGSKYRIEVTRSNPHNATPNDYIYWWTSKANSDPYPEGSNDLYPVWTMDYAFRTHTNGGVDQQQTNAAWAWPISNTRVRWQEFVADYPKVNLTSVQVYLYAGRNLPISDTLTLIVHGLGSSYRDSVKYVAKVPAASLTPGFHWRTFNVHGSLYRDQSFNMTLYRKGIHDGSRNNMVYWCASDGSTDLYPDGSTDRWYERALQDYAFKTFTQGGLDQQQLSVTDTIPLLGGGESGYIRYQRFVPAKQ